ncbi:MAG: hypothetical protein Kow0025_07280 [Thermodesulfovibrionales bacterium]
MPAAKLPDAANTKITDKDSINTHLRMTINTSFGKLRKIILVARNFLQHWNPRRGGARNPGRGVRAAARGRPGAGRIDFARAL